MSDTPTLHTITVNAAEQDHLIDSVTVFQANRAEVKRRVQLQLQLQKGQNQISIERLPTHLVEGSLRVQGTGNAIIFDVVYHYPIPQDQPRYGRRHVASEPSDEEDEGLAEQVNAVEALKKQRSIVEDQISFLSSYGRVVVGNQDTSAENVGRFLDLYGSRRDAMNKRVQELDAEIDRAEKAIRTARKLKQKPVASHEINGHRVTKITVTVMSKKEGKAELMLAYVVSNASWTPVYEIRASISSTPNVPSTIALHYRALLTQETEEDWPDVALTLSMAAPYRGASMPTLSTWRIGIPTPRGRDRSWSPPNVVHICELSRSPRQVIRIGSERRHSSSSSSSDWSQTTGIPEAQYKPTPMATRQADTVDAGVLSATFTIPGRSNIPSDGGKHKVLIASLDFQVDPEWVCIPRKDVSVFLRCKIVNSSEFTFLPGEASVFIGDNFVSKSQIQHVPPSDPFQLSLGVDPALRVTYPLVRTHKRMRSQSGFTFPGRQKQPKQETTKYSQQIAIQNTRPTAVLALYVLDHVPVSNDSTVRVNLTSPQGLRPNNRPAEEDTTAEKQDGSDAWIRPQQGARARWAPTDIGGEGAIEWLCAIGAGDEMELKLGWEINVPEGTSWGNL
ncbi:Protein F37C4,5 [Caenorhabditis elegans] [Rhizoctonia solani]|uniref:Protein F37C4,5 [Caenorhabditis elegans] n=1 Tax=Rhizoctonia solani TaxID=456999 RepID=A0A0K6G7R6_9AGAM|nr:Protein F37C4,5 [Caenorhabditis elegans] [Rhizoctonia solani]